MTVAALLAVTAATAAPDPVVVDPERLAGDLIVVQGTAADPTLGPLAGPASDLLDRLVAHQDDGLLVRLGGDDRLTWSRGERAVATAALAPRLATLLRRLEDLRLREAAATLLPVPTARLTAALAAPDGQRQVAALFRARMAEPPFGDADRGGRVWFESGGLAFVEERGATATVRRASTWSRSATASTSSPLSSVRSPTARPWSRCMRAPRLSCARSTRTAS